MDAVQLGPRDDLGYRRPPVTASFEALRSQGLPEVLFVHSFLPEGVTICDVNGFAAMIEEAYGPPARTLLVDAPDEDGNQRCRGVGNNGIWEWGVIIPRSRSAWRMTLAPERDGQRQATIAAVTYEHRREVTGATLATFPVSARPAGEPRAGNAVELGPKDAMGYRRPPVTVSFDGLSQRGVPRLLFVNAQLPEGIVACDIGVFAAMIKQAYQEGALRFTRQDEHGDDQCVGLGGTGIWQWGVVRAGKPVNGERYAAPHQGICRILLAPEKDGKRVCAVDLNGHPGHEPEDDSPITFTIRTRTVSLVSLARGEGVDSPADLDEAVGMALSWLADVSPASSGLLRLLACLPPGPVPLQGLLLAGRDAALPGPEAAALIGPLLGDPAAVSEARGYLGAHSVVGIVPGQGHQVHPLARAAVRARLTAEESAHWRQAGIALVDAAAAADPQILLRYARSVPGSASYGTGPDGPGTRGRRRLPGGWGPVPRDG
jgi:hypothetical protein